MTTTKRYKVTSAVTAVAVALAIVLSGTFAWQSISQMALNETAGDINPGARLHDDFDGRNKDVYVENFTDPNHGGAAIFARIRLDEYMEIGAGAGLKTGDADYDSKDATPLVPGTNINDVSTWTTHIPTGTAADCTNGFHAYWSWDMGGQTVYMPTFNMNKDSLAADINGTYEGTDPDDDIHYDDYKSYVDGETKTSTEVWDADDNDMDEGDGAVEGANISSIADQTHVAKATQNATVLTMAEWKAMGSPVGKYWVYDTDGWAYWAEAIMPGEATGLLLDGINLDRDPDDNWYYAINVVGQFTSRGDWGQNNGTGFYDPAQGTAPTDDALLLLNKAANLLSTVTAMSMQEGTKAYVKAGESITLNPVVTVRNETGNAMETNVRWSISPATGTFSAGTFAPTEAMAGQIYTVTATSTYDTEYSASTDVYVYPADAAGVVSGVNDGKTYVKYDDNTYRELKADGSLGDYVCAGKDETIGNADDAAVVTVNPADATYGGKFLGPNNDDSYYAPGADGKLGTDDDIKVWSSSTWPNDISTENPDEAVKADLVTVTAADNANKVRAGKTLQFSAKVSLSGTPITNQSVTWTVTGTRGVASGTSVSNSGLLTVAANETSGNTLIVRAISQEDNRVVGEKRVTVTTVPEALAAIENITPGSTSTVTIDGIEFYVLAKQDDKALLFSKNILEERAFDSSDNRWMSSSMRTYLNGDWLSSKTTLSQYAVETELKTIQEFDSSSLDTTKDKVFLLSEADVFGSSGNVTVESSHYTTGAKLAAPGGSWSAQYLGSNDWWWLRSPSFSGDHMANVNREGSVDYYYLYHGTQGGVRPALWVNLES